MTCATPSLTCSLFLMETLMNEKHLTPVKPVEQLHVRINQIEVSATGRFSIMIVVGAILLAIILA